MYSILFIVFNSLLFRGISCYPSGAPQNACDSMTPQHGAAAQSGVSPFRVRPIGKSYYEHGKPAEITIESSGPSTIKGLLLQAREVGKNAAIGTFLTIPSGLKYLACNNNPKSAVTHSARGAWKAVNVSWSPPADVSAMGNISFFATVVKDRSTFWVKLESPELYKMEQPVTMGPTSMTNAMTSTMVKEQPVTLDPTSMTNGMTSTMAMGQSVPLDPKSTASKMTSTMAMKPIMTTSAVVTSSSVANTTSCPPQKCGAHAFVPHSLLLLLSVGLLIATGKAL